MDIEQQESHQSQEKSQKILGPLTPELKKEIFAELEVIFLEKNLSMNNDNEGQFEDDLDHFISEYRVEDESLLRELIEEYKEQLRLRIVAENNKKAFGT